MADTITVEEPIIVAGRFSSHVFLKLSRKEIESCYFSLIVVSVDDKKIIFEQKKKIRASQDSVDGSRQ